MRTPRAERLRARGESLGATRARPHFPRTSARPIFSAYRDRILVLETQLNPLGVLWAGLGLSGFYIALIWINSLLGIFLTPLFLIPVTWFVGGKKKEPAPPRA